MSERFPRDAPPANGSVLGSLAAQLWRAARRTVVLVLGSTVVLVGVIMIFTPGPAVVVIPAGLAILASEFVWAARLLHRIRSQVKHAVQSVAGTSESSREASGQPEPAPTEPAAPWYRRLWPLRRPSA